MESNREFFSLSEIFLEYKYVFPDANAFLELGDYLNTKDLINKISSEDRRSSLFDFWREGFSKYNGLLITRGIFDELNEGSYNYNKASKKTSDNKLVIQLRRAKRDSIKKRNLLLSSILEKIYLFDEGSVEREAYDKLHSYYSYFKNCSDKIGETDFDLLITGAIFTKFKGNTAIISNDFAIKKTWNRLMKNENIKMSNFGFYFQRGLNYFERGFVGR